MADFPVYDVVIPYHPKDEEILTQCVTSIRKYAVSAATIYIVSAVKPAESLFSAVPGVKWVPETAYPMSKEDVQAILKSTNGREGWYYQQFLKLYCFQAIEGLRDTVLLFDSDVVLQKKIRFLGPNGTLLMDWGTQLNRPYFEHAEKLLGSNFKRLKKTLSGIVDHIMTRRDIVSDLLRTVEALHPGKPAWVTMLELIPPRDINGAGMSEYELLFNWTFIYFPHAAKLRKLVWDYEIKVFHDYMRKNKPKVG